MQHLHIQTLLAGFLMLISTALSAAEQWRYDEHTSEWLHTHVSYAFAESPGDSPDSLVILCRDDEISAYVHTNAYLGEHAKGINYSIDGDNFNEAEWTHADSFDGTVTFYKCPKQLARKLAEGKEFSVAYSDANGQQHKVEYSLEMAKQPIEKVLQACA